MIVVLDPEVPEQEVAEITTEASALGFHSELSRGEEQSVLAFSGSGDLNRLERYLRHRSGTEVVRILSGSEYRTSRIRRRFMSVLVVPLAIAMALGWFFPIVGFLRPPTEPLSAPNLLRAADAGSMAPNSARLVLFHGQPVLLVHMDKQHYYAMRALCTYEEDCQLEWDTGRRQLLCPCHGCGYDVHGNIVQGPPSIPLVTYEVTRLGDGIFIRRKG